MMCHMIKQCCVPLELETIEQLKEKTGRRALKDALTTAVDFAIERYEK